MFSLRDVLDIAVRIEENGEAAYLKARDRVRKPDLAETLTWLAEEERKHAAWFAGLMEKTPATNADPGLEAMARRVMQDALEDKSFSLDDEDFSRMETVAQVLTAAIALEEDTVLFYEMLQGFIPDQDTREELGAIIAEEKRHAEALARYVMEGRTPLP